MNVYYLQIKRYPRTIGESVRRKDERRKQQREAVAERKAKEKERVRGEIAELKKLKRTAIEDKLKKLKDVTGNEALPLKVEDLQGDFDPDEYDRLMQVRGFCVNISYVVYLQSVFDEKYYTAAEEDEQKPVFSDSDEEVEESDEKKSSTSKTVRSKGHSAEEIDYSQGCMRLPSKNQACNCRAEVDRPKYEGLGAAGLRGCDRRYQVPLQIP